MHFNQQNIREVSDRQQRNDGRSATPSTLLHRGLPGLDQSLIHNLINIRSTQEILSNPSLWLEGTALYPDRR